MPEVSDVRRIVPEPRTVQPARNRKEKRSRKGSEQFNSELRKQAEKEPGESGADDEAQKKGHLGREDKERKPDGVSEDELTDAEASPDDEDTPDLPTGRIVDIKV